MPCVVQPHLEVERAATAAAMMNTKSDFTSWKIKVQLNVPPHHPVFLQQSHPVQSKACLLHTYLAAGAPLAVPTSVSACI